MPLNVEIKARVDDPGRLRAAVEELSDIPAEVIAQEDMFFDVPEGRLKLRTFADGRGELIFYNRPDIAGPKASDYQIVRVAEPLRLKVALARALGVRAVVRKTRTLYRIGQTRVHLDDVQGLGAFVELEVVLAETQPVAEGIRIAEELLERLGIPRESLVAEAYVDLLEGGSG